MTSPATTSKLSSSASHRATSGRYHPRDGDDRRILRGLSKTPRRLRIRPIVRTDGTESMRRYTSSSRMALALYSPRTLSSRSSLRTARILSSMSRLVLVVRCAIGGCVSQSTRSRRFPAARASQCCTVETGTPNSRATCRWLFPRRTALTTDLRCPAVRVFFHHILHHRSVSEIPIKPH